MNSQDKLPLEPKPDVKTITCKVSAGGPWYGVVVNFTAEMPPHEAVAEVGWLPA